jgi:hypothetical protein
MSTVVKQLTLQVCDVCGLVREQGKSPGDIDGDEAAWLNFSSLLERRGLRGMDYRLSRAYCPICLQQYVLSGTISGEEAQFTTHNAQPITRLVLQTIGHNPGCSLEALMQACRPFTWNQILLEIDRLSRSSDIRLSLSGRGRYILQLSPRRTHLTQSKPSPAMAGIDTPISAQSNSV